MTDEADLAYLLLPRGEISAIGSETGKRVRDGIARFRSPHGSSRYVLYENGDPVAALQVMRRDDDSGVIANVYTHPDRRRRGHASTLLHRALRDFTSIEHSEHMTSSGTAWKRGVTTHRNISATSILRGDPQLFPVDDLIYYWSPEDGEVCVEVEKNTPAEFWLTRCPEAGRPPTPFRVIRRGDPLFEDAERIYIGHGYEPDFLMRFGGAMTSAHIYYRDGEVRYWSPKKGEIPVRMKPGSVERGPFGGRHGVLLSGDSRIPILPHHVDQYYRALRKRTHALPEARQTRQFALPPAPRSYAPEDGALSENPERARLKRRLMRG